MADVGDNSIAEDGSTASIERQLRRELFTNADFGGKMHTRYKLGQETVKISQTIYPRMYTWLFQQGIRRSTIN